VEIGTLEGITQHDCCGGIDVEPTYMDSSFAEHKGERTFAARSIEYVQAGVVFAKRGYALGDGILNRTEGGVQTTIPSVEVKQEAARKMAAHAKTTPAAIAPTPVNAAPRYSPQIASFVKISRTAEAITSSWNQRP